MRLLTCLAVVLGFSACDVPPSVDAGTDAGELRDTGPDAGPPDAGPPPQSVPVNGWTNAIADHDPATSIELDGQTWDNVAVDPDEIIGPPDGSSGTYAIGPMGFFVVCDLGEGEEAFDGIGDDIEVVENDFPTGFPEAYEVAVSDSPNGPFVVVGQAMGSERFDLAEVGVASARYVRVMGTSTISEIVNGPGSEEYPGAEIDAVGAFHPGSAEP